MKGKIILVSACLLGLRVRYDGTHAFNKRAAALAKYNTLIPVCPEIFGGLGIPREQAEQQNGGIVTKSGRDITKYYLRGAEAVLKIAEIYGLDKISLAILKHGSPSCGSGRVYNGTFTGKMRQGDGVTTRLLRKCGIEIISEKKL